MSQVRVSDHALLRWLERTGALPVEELRTMLASSIGLATGAAARLETARFSVVADGLVYVVRDGTLVTVIEDRGPRSRFAALEQPRGYGSLGEP